MCCGKRRVPVGGNTRGESIAMTTPVVQAPPKGETIPMTAPETQTGKPGAWTVRFMMPRTYTLETLPKPNDTPVKIVVLPPSRVGVVRSSGLAQQADIERYTSDIAAFLETRQLKPAGAASLARYNPPWTFWFFRRNEIMITIE
jgi:hypothetical protein